MREVKNKYCNVFFFRNGTYTVSKPLEIFLSVDGGFISKNVFQQDFNLSYVCTMQYNRIISDILKYLKYLAVDRTTPVKEGSQPTCSLPYYFETIISNEKCTKIIYNSLNEANMLFLLQFQSGTLNCLHLDLLTYVYMMFIKFVLKLLLILRYNGYSIEFSIKFFLSIFILFTKPFPYFELYYMYY